MPAKKKETEEKIIIRQFRDKSSHFWVDYSHFMLNEQNEIVWCAGESPNESKLEALTKYIKNNKKKYAPREIVVLKEYNEIVTFGKHSQKTVQFVYDTDKSWLKWCRDNYNFSSAQKELKEQIIEILK